MFFLLQRAHLIKSTGTAQKSAAGADELRATLVRNMLSKYDYA
jgi:hypothetical protein